jgi:hypothetical protein
LSRRAKFKKKTGYAYMLCGWHTLSDIPLTNVPISPARGAGKTDIHIEFATGTSPIVKNTGNVVFEHSMECSHIGIQGVADFEVSKGRRIRIWPAVRAIQQDIEIILLGPAWATLCHQRGLLPLHASAIVTGGSIIAFAGHSGVGKSTTAAILGSSDNELIADDILPISFNRSSVPGAWPYLRRLKLRDDSINHLGITPTERVSGTLDNEKYFVPPKYPAADKWARLEQLYLLEINQTDSRISIEKLTGAGTVHALVDHTYHFQFILSSGRFREHLAFCTQLASKITVYRLRRPPSFEAGKELRSLICAHVGDGRNHRYQTLRDISSCG